MAAESKLESFMAREVEKVGGIFWKFKSSRRGVPDRIFIYRGLVVFVEMKAPGEKLTKQQQHVHDLLRANGATTTMIDSELGALMFIQAAVKAEAEAQAAYQRLEALSGVQA